MLEKYLPDGNDRAVSPVIGVVLMVGIVVALGAVVGAAVLGLGVGVGDTAPNAQFDATYDADAADGSVDLTVEHVAGDTVERDSLSYTNNATGVGSNFANAEVTAGDTATFEVSDTSEPFQIQWSSDNGETSSVLFEYEVPA